MTDPDMLDALLADMQVPRTSAEVAGADQAMQAVKTTLAELGVDTDDRGQMRAALAAIAAPDPAYLQGMLYGLGLLVRELEHRRPPRSEADRDRRDRDGR